jgi:isoleucyl-tRNA synthetase
VPCLRARQIDNQREDFMRMGVIGDWENPYLTMDFAFEADIVRTLGRLVERGHLHKGFKPVHWCLDCGSALAEAEVEYADKQSRRPSMWPSRRWTPRRSTPPAAPTTAEAVAVPIWTTTPWTLPANQAVSLHPELDYVLIDARDRRCWSPRSSPRTAPRATASASQRSLGRCRGAALEGQLLQHPFLERQVPVILGDHVTTDAGYRRGAHGPGPRSGGLRRRPALRPARGQPGGPNGVFIEGTPLFAGQHVFKANEAIIELLRERGALLHDEAYEHSYPHCWRHKTPVIFRATPQWFMSMQARTVCWRPRRRRSPRCSGCPTGGRRASRHAQPSGRTGASRASAPGACPSRCSCTARPRSCTRRRPSSSRRSPSADREVGGIDAWFDLDPAELLGDEAVDYDKVTDTLDVWFDSGVTHACVLRRREGWSRRPISTWRARTSIAAGSSPRC